MKSVRSFLIGITIIGSLAASLHFLHAQETATPVQGGAVSTVDWNSASDLQVILQAIESVPPSPATAAPRGGTFYSAQHAPGTRSAWPPLPGNMNNLPVWSLGDGLYLLDDVQENDSAPLSSLRMSGGMMEEGGGPVPPGYGGAVSGGDTNGFYSDSFNFSITNYGTNLWLQLTNIGNRQFHIIAHNVADQDWIQLFTKTNLSDAQWAVQEDNWVDSGSNFTFATMGDWDASATNGQRFFWTKQLNDLIGASTGGEAVRPSPGFAASPAYITINYNPADGLLTSNLAVYFSLSGTATNGVDFVLRNYDTGEILTNSITILANNPLATIELDPTTNLLCVSNLTVILTLDDSPDYLIDSSDYNVGFPASTNTIDANVFSLVATVPAPCGMDYSPFTNSLIVSSQSGNNWSFVRIDANGVVTSWSSAQFSSIGGYEIKLATAKTTANGFTSGTMFFDNGQYGIGQISPDGSVVNTSWLAMSGYHFLGLYLDQSGCFGTYLIALRSGDGIWEINAMGVSNRLASLSDYMEGLVSLPNDTNQYGPWAGKIVTGNATDPSAIYLVDTNGQISGSPLNIEIEDADIIANNQNLYCNDETEGWILKMSQGLFTNHVGDVLITVSGIDGLPGLFIVHWDATTANFTVTPIPIPSSITSFEHVTFAPIDIPPVSP